MNVCIEIVWGARNIILKSFEKAWKRRVDIRPKVDPAPKYRLVARLNEFYSVHTLHLMNLQYA